MQSKESHRAQDSYGLLPTDEQVYQLKRELNFLLWTEDTVPLPRELRLPARLTEEYKGPNIQCVAHTLITSAFFMNRGFQVTTRSGMAFII